MDTLIGSEWPSSSAQSNTFTNANDTKEIPVDNGVDNDPDDYISKHANGNCGGEGHKAAECENRRLIDRSDVPDMTKEEAWKLLEQAAADKEMSDFRRGVQALAKADPELSYVDLEKMFREKNMGLHLIARGLLSANEQQSSATSQKTANRKLIQLPFRHVTTVVLIIIASVNALNPALRNHKAVDER
ncbi:MAG: hypothetical protein Q9159_003040 [Coniocarpon cinnabarinum]